MIYQYVVTLKNQQTRYIDILGILLSTASLLLFLLQLANGSGAGWAYIAGSVSIIGILGWNIYQSRFHQRKVYYSRALLIAALVWMKMPYYQWLSFVFIVLALLEYQAKYSVEVGFSDNEVVLNTLLKKRYAWQHFNNIILKDGLLTLDFSSNKVLQKEIEDDEDDDADEDEFNEYCRQQLMAVRKKS